MNRKRVDSYSSIPVKQSIRYEGKFAVKEISDAKKMTGLNRG